MAMHPVRTSVRTAAWVVLSTALFVAVTGTHALSSVQAEIGDRAFWPRLPDESAWIRGANFGYPWRQTQSWLSQDLLLPLFGDRWAPHLLTSLGLYPVIALLLALAFRGLVRRLATPIVDIPGLAELGGTMAGLAFVWQAKSHAFNTSTLSYRLAAASALLALVLALQAKGRHAWAWWGATCLAVGLALFSHLFALALPVFLLLLELVLWRGGEGARPARRLGIRLGLLSLPLALLLWVHGSAIRMATEGAGMHPDAMDLSEKLRLFPWFLRFSIEQMWKPHLQIGAHVGWPAWLQLAGVVALCVLGLWAALRPGGRVGWIAAIPLFFVGWAMGAYPAAVAGVASLSSGHRYEYPVIGACLAGTFLLCLALAAVARRIPPAGLRWLPGALALLVAVGLCARSLDISAAQGALAELPNRDRPLCPGATGAARHVGQDLRHVDMSGRSLDGACFLWATLDQADLTGASLRGASFLGASLMGAQLQGADLAEAELSNSTSCQFLVWHFCHWTLSTS
jgi:hypothetical protein